MDRKQTWSFCRERRSDFSLEIRAIQPSAVFETRKKTALHGEGFAWVPDLGSLLKLREVGVSPYLRFILRLSVFTMFELNEAVRGRLIGHKSWDRIVINFLNPNGATVTATVDLGGLIVYLCVESCIGLVEAGDGREMRDHKVTR